MKLGGRANWRTVGKRTYLNAFKFYTLLKKSVSKIENAWNLHWLIISLEAKNLNCFILRRKNWWVLKDSTDCSNKLL